MIRELKMLVGCVVCLMLTGCMETTQEYFINPDGSGKVVYEALLQPLDISFGEKKTPEQKVKGVVRDELEKAKGVEAWRDVSFASEDDDVRFKGTAYFRDIAQLKFHNGGISVGLYNDIDFSSDNGKIRLNIASKKEKTADNTAKAPVAELSEDEVDGKIADARGEYEKTKLMMGAALSMLRISRTFHLPGNLISSRNFKKNTDGSIVHEVHGADMMAAIDSMMADDELLRREIMEGRNPVKDGMGSDEQMNAMLFGEEAGVKAIFLNADRPLFDYSAEVALAKEETKTFMDQLGIMQKHVVRADLGDAAEFRVGGIRAVYESDMQNNIRPFNYDQGLVIALIGMLPEVAINATGGNLISALTDNGEDLLPETEWNRKISFPRLGEDKQTVVFELNLDLPSAQARAIAELTGVIEFVVGATTRTVDLGITQFAAGQEGSEFGALIKTLGDNQWNPGQQNMELKVDLNKDKVKEVRLYDADGSKLDVSQGYSAMSDQTIYSYSLKEGQFPEVGRIEIEVYEDLQKYELPFKVTDIPILGR